jgi:hypothetical protein
VAKKVRGYDAHCDVRTADLSESSNAFFAFAAQDLRKMMYDALRHRAIPGLAGLDRVAC